MRADRGIECRIAPVYLGIFRQFDRDVQNKPVARRCVMVTAAHGLENRIAVETWREKAGQAALASEERGARIAGAGTSFVAVGIRHDANAVALFEGIAHDPFERAPGGMHLDRGLELAVVRVEDVGVAPADMGCHDAILVFQFLEQRVRRMGVGAFVAHIGRVGNLRMRRPENWLAFVTIMNVAVAADGGVGGPFVSRNADEGAGAVEFGRQTIERDPEVAGDLKIVALVSHHVEEGLVASELEIFARGIGAERFVRLAVRVAPEMHELGMRRGNAQRVRSAQFAAAVV